MDYDRCSRKRSGTVADTSRRKFLVGATAALSAVGAIGVATPFVASWKPSAKAMASRRAGQSRYFKDPPR